ncbi:MAG: hypothetical protein VCC04_03765, partial [Myxococcota bacterium]
MNSPVKAIFFDLGGTLFSYRRLPRAAGQVLQEAARRLGASQDLKDVGRAFARASRKAGRDFRDRNYYLHRDLFMA